MKLKIRGRLLLLTIFLIVFSFIVQSLFNQLFLNRYYEMKRKQQIKELGTDLINNNYNSEDLLQMKEKHSVDIDFVEGHNLNRVESKFELKSEDGVLKAKVEQTVDKIQDDFFYESEQNQTRFLIYYKKHDTGYIRIKTNMEMMNKSITIMNKFIIYSAFVAFTFGILLSVIFSKYFLEPIYKINKKLHNLAKLDFSERLELNTKDEFQELSENINFVSNELENKIQDLKVANMKLREDIDREKRFERKRREFISNVTHEIKTPITVINTYAESLAEGYVTDEEKRKFYANIIVEEGENITKLVDDFLKIIKNEYDANALQLESFDLLEVLETELRKFKIDLEEKEVRYNINCNIDDVMVEADKEKIEHVINNFMSNAVSYVTEKGYLNINVLSENNSYLIEIENSGVHIADENLEEVWKPFFKEDKARNRKYGGTGLGLSIVRETLRNHNQRFGVVNTEIGVKFWFELKKVKVDKKSK